MGDKEKQKYFAKFQSILMQVAKSGIISRNNKKISRVSKNKNNQFQVDPF